MKVKFLSAGGSGGGDTNTNLGNTNLTADATTRSYKVATGGVLKFQTKAGTNSLNVNDSGEVIIGGATPYTMPTARASGSNQLIRSTDGTGGMGFATPTIPKGKMVISFTGTIGTFENANYGFFKKNGGTMLESTNANFGNANGIGIEWQIWDAKTDITHYRVDIMYDNLEGTETGCQMAIFSDTLSGNTSFSGTFNAGAITGLHSSGSWTSYTGEFTFPVINGGDVWTLYIQNREEIAMENLYIIVSLYCSDAISWG